MIRHYCDGCATEVTKENGWKGVTEFEVIDSKGGKMGLAKIIVGTMPSDGDMCIPCIKKQVGAALDMELEIQQEQGEVCQN